jgi:hypothetical protein
MGSKREAILCGMHPQFTDYKLDMSDRDTNKPKEVVCTVPPVTSSEITWA